MTLLLIDAASMYFRAFHAVPSSVTAPDGMPVNAIRGYLDMTASVITKRRTSGYVACLDADWRPKFRTDLVPSYKAHRQAPAGGEDVPDELVPQVPVLLEVLAALGLCAIGSPGFEADDVIATLAAASDGPVEVLSGDRDMLAVVDKDVRLLYTGRGIAKLADMGPEAVRAEYGIDSARYPDFAALRGDPSDGLPGVAGVGPKTASALVERFGSIEQLLAAAEAGSDGFPSSTHSKVTAAAEYLRAAVGVVRPRIDVPVSVTNDQTLMPREPHDPDRLVELCDRYGLDSSVNRMLKVMADR